MAKTCGVGKRIIKDGKEVYVCDDTRSKLLPVLQKIQAEKGMISDSDMQTVAGEFGIHPVEVYSVATFYAFLSVKEQGRHIIRVSNCVSCVCAGSGQIIKAFEKELNIKVGETTSDKEFTLLETSCIGMCDQAPAVFVDGKLVGSLTPEKVVVLVKELRANPSKLSGLYPVTSEKRSGNVIFSEIAPYSGLKKALELGRSSVLEQVRSSGIRGRGGAGFPTGVKWNLAAAAQSDQKFVVCNADEGEPGTFKDRVLLTEYAQLIFEGMAIAAVAIGADKGILYLRGEYLSFVGDLETELDKMRKNNALGQNIMGKGFNFDIEIRLGSGAYVCGEETALIESLEGNRGEPRNRPPFPVNTGFLGMPTVVNNVETCIAVTHIIAKGVDWFKTFGTEKSYGTKVISVSGDCKKPGVYEVDFGITISDILKLVQAEDTQAVQVGGASGICLFDNEFQRLIGYEDVPTGGAIIVFNKSRNMLDIVGNFLEFFQEESCGQCTPCREGIPVLIEMLEAIKKGERSEKELSKLFSLSETMQCASKCGLGQSSPNAFLSVVNKLI
ncbi:MAG: NAD(P)H-dependent oxidoreductase subunit E [Candidatus Omnitrophica bacterium]|nr:NAD(P)H-dependent oxidoreductase subunit E [Candidatus Omnitrophota bacterium]